MAWEAATALEVSKIAGVRVEDLQDWWYDSAVALIGEKASRYNIADTTSVTDTLDGSGTARMAVRRPPISSITSVTVDDVLISSTRYVADGGYVVLIDRIDVNPYIAGEVFVPGVKNVSIVYVSGSTGDDAVKLAIALIVKEMANLASSEGAESRLQFTSTDRTSSQSRRFNRSGAVMASRIDVIIEDLLGRKLKAV